MNERDILDLRVKEIGPKIKDFPATLQSFASYIRGALNPESAGEAVYRIAKDGFHDGIKESVETFQELPVGEIQKQVKSGQLSIAQTLCALAVIGSVQSGVAVSLPEKTVDPSGYLESPTFEGDVESAKFEWMGSQVDGLTNNHKPVSPVEWACTNRYLPRSVTAMPGPYRIEVTPYLEEILECLSPESPVRELAFMKGVQIAATVGVIENFVGYLIDHIKSSPAMLVTADNDLASNRIENNILPMLQESDLMGLIKSSDGTNKRKTGATKKLIQWEGGGFLMPLGAQNPNKFRSVSIQYLMRDEVDSYPAASKDGDAMRLTFDRTSSYEATRKIIDVSTPSLRPSNIEKRFKLGDQREYRVPCKKCGELQALEWDGRNPDGSKFGIKWETDEEGKLIPESSRYVCRFCFHEHINEDKSWMLAKENGARWFATATPARPNMRSYHLSALYSPVGMQSWDTCVLKWLEAWDVQSNRVRSNEELQVFNNNVRGIPFEEKGVYLSFQEASRHRRFAYKYGEIPNIWAEKHLGQKVQFLTCQVDVHKRNLAVSVMGWTRGQKCVLVDYWRFLIDGEEGSTCEDLTSRPWRRLRELIEDKVYLSDDGREYRVQMTLIDSNYYRETVVTFCGDYGSGVYAIEGMPYTGKIQRQFYEFTTAHGDLGFRIIVDYYKDRLAPVLRRDWSEDDGEQPVYSFNAPMNATDKQIMELTKEERRQKTNEKGQVSYYWHRPGNAANELWDLLVYGHAAVEIMARQLCITDLEMETVDWEVFWGWLETNPVWNLAEEGATV